MRLSSEYLFAPIPVGSERTAERPGHLLQGRVLPPLTVDFQAARGRVPTPATRQLRGRLHDRRS